MSSDEQIHTSLDVVLRPDCCFHRAAGYGEALALVRRFQPMVVICDEYLPDGDWRDLLHDLQQEERMPAFIVSSRLADERLWAEVLNLGGYDLLATPFAASEVSRVVSMAVQRERTDSGLLTVSRAAAG